MGWKKVYLAAFTGFMLLSILGGCGGGSGSDSGDKSENTVFTLAKIAESSDRIYLSEDRIYFSDYNRGRLYSVPISGGEISCHLNNGSSIRDVIVNNGTIYTIITSGDGMIGSIPETAEDALLLSGKQELTDTITDMVADDNYLYWTEFTSRIDSISRLIRVPVTITSSGKLSNGISTDILFEKQHAGRLRLAIDNDLLYISEADTGDVGVLDIQTGNYSNLATGLPNQAQLSGIALTQTQNYIYATLSLTEIAEINKIDGTTRIYACQIYFGLNSVRSDDEGVYWWENDAYPDITLKRLDSLSGDISDIAALPFRIGDTTEVYDFYVDGSEVWWFNSANYYQVELRDVDILNGHSNVIETYDYDHYCSSNGIKPYWLIGDSQDIIWNECGNIWRLSKSGGTPSFVTDGAGHSRLMAYNGSFFKAGDGVFKVPQNGITADPVIEWTGEGPGGWPECYVSDNANLYWIADYYDRTTNSRMSKIYSMSFADRSVQTLNVMSGDVYGRGLEVYEDTIVLAWENWGDGYVTISKMPKAGGPVVDLIQVQEVLLVKMAVENDILYYTANGLYSFDLNTHQAKTLVPGLINAEGLYVDENHVYWTRAGSHHIIGGVDRIPKGGGERESLFSGSRSHEISGDEDYIYWASYEGILKMKK